jgi:hypothetical protein
MSDSVTRLAEKIAEKWRPDDPYKFGEKWLRSLLREAMENEYKKGIIDSSYSEGLKDAYTRAAEVARKHSEAICDGDNCAKEIAAAIEALRKE